MIYIKFGGRLGNQLFQYAFARYLQKKYYPGDNLVFNFELVENQGSSEDGWKNSLSEFNIIPYTVNGKTGLSMIQMFFGLLYYIGNRINIKNIIKGKFDESIQPYINLMGIYISRKTYYVPVKKTVYFKNKYVRGRFESHEYCDLVRSELIEELKPINPILSHNIGLYERIVRQNSICITIRRGDFLSPENKIFNVCDEKYFYNGMRYINENIDDAKFFVFSDDIEWVKKNMKFPYPVEYEKNNGKDPAWEKLRLMSACKHFVISNSTFSWWVQYLSQNKDKIVVAPYMWRIGEECSGLYLDDFVLLEV